MCWFITFKTFSKNTRPDGPVYENLLLIFDLASQMICTLRRVRRELHPLGNHYRFADPGSRINGKFWYTDPAGLVFFGKSFGCYKLPHLTVSGNDDNLLWLSCRAFKDCKFSKDSGSLKRLLLFALRIWSLGKYPKESGSASNWFPLNLNSSRDARLQKSSGKVDNRLLPRSQIWAHENWQNLMAGLKW